MKKLILTITVVASVLAVWYGCKKEEKELPGSIYGVITDKATGEPVRAAGVQLSSGETTVTGNEGQYEFAELEAKKYSITVNKTGYTTLTNFEITVEAGKTVKGDVQIEKLPAALRIVNDSRTDIDKVDFGNALSDITRSFNIFNDSPEPFEWEITTTALWISSISKTNGILNAGKTQGIIITIDRDSLIDGQNITTIHVTSDNGNKAITVIAIKGSISNDYEILSAAELMVAKEDINETTMTWNTANSACENSIMANFTDWRLPTKDELMVLYNHKTEIGGFKSDYYWSSTSSSWHNYHWVQRFETGAQYDIEDNKKYWVRCVRNIE
jgi:hypothetical protein